MLKIPDGSEDVLVIHSFEDKESVKRLLESEDIKKKLQEATVVAEEIQPTVLESIDFLEIEKGVREAA